MPARAVYAAEGQASQPGATAGSAFQSAWSILADVAKEADAGPMGANGVSDWRSTCDLTSACAGPMSDKMASSGFAGEFQEMEPHNFAGRKGAILTLNQHGDSVFFNKIAQPTVTACASGSCGQSNFPVGSVIGRFAWMQVQRGDCATFAAFDPVADAATYSPSKPVMIETSKPCKADPKTMVVPLSHFFSVPVSALNHRAFLAPHGEVLREGDIAVVLGFHLIKKIAESNSPDHGWVWMTFWWSAQPDIRLPSPLKGIRCEDTWRCPHNARKPDEWTQYVLNTVILPVSNDTPFEPISNPYVDPPQAPRANCIVCHSFAMLPGATNAGSLGATACGGQSAALVTRNALLASMQTYSNTCEAHHRIPSDGVWTLSKLFGMPACGAKVCVNAAP